MTRTPGTDARLMTRLREADPAPPSAFDERAEADLAAILATQVVQALPPRRRPLVLVAAAAVVALGVGAVVTGVVQRDDDGVRGGPPVAAADAPAASASSPPARTSAPGAQELLADLGSRTAYDYQPAQTPSELASGADLVAVGELVAAAPQGEGRDCDGAGGQSPQRSGVVVRLDRLEVAKGQPDLFTVLVVVPVGGEEGLESALPVGTRVLVYASAGSSAECREVYLVTSPQGFAVQAADGRVVWPLIGEVRDGDLTQALPGGSLIAP